MNCPFAQLSTEADESHSGICAFTPSGVQCGECPLYAKWEKTKKNAYDIKMPLALDHHPQEVFNIQQDSFDVMQSAKKLHTEMEKRLSEKHYIIYRLIYIENIPDEKVAETMGYKSNEKGERLATNRLKTLKKFLAKAAEILDRTDIIM